MAAERRGPFYDPITGFSDALVPILTAFEQSRIETTLRGIIARADSFPGFRASDTKPSEHGLYLNVAVRDVTEIEGSSDRTEHNGGVTRRLVQVPPPTDGEMALVIALDYGSDIPQEVIREIDKCIQRIVALSKKRTKP